MNKKTGRTTIYDVAKVANVSAATVSKALNYPESSGITVATRDRILSAARQLNYTKATVPSSDFKRDLKRVAVVIPSLMNPYYALMISGIEQVLRAEDMLMTLYCSNNDPKLETKAVNQIAGTRVSGVIISSICSKTGHIRKLIDSGISVVAVEQQVDLPCNKAYFDYNKAGFMAVDHLVKAGRTNIAFISSPLTRSSRRQVFEGYKNGLLSNGLRMNRQLIRIARNEIDHPNELYEHQNGFALARSLLEEEVPVDGIFCINDITAIGAIHAIQERRISIPEEIAVVGFDNIVFSKMLTPALTTIEQPAHQLGSLSANILIRNIRDTSMECVSVMFEPKLFVRDSG